MTERHDILANCKIIAKIYNAMKCKYRVFNNDEAYNERIPMHAILFDINRIHKRSFLSSVMKNTLKYKIIV